ncbi:MAG TPA: glycosyltransferase [Drouetiella sp.]|jgi:teichuronic acid biosynthesis glycosyltransferase TuaH
MTVEPSHRILFISLEHWDNVWRRNQIVCAQLLSRYPQAEILWVGPPTDLWNLNGIKSVNAPLGTLFRPAGNELKLYALKPFKLLPNKLGRKLNEKLFVDGLTAALKKLGWGKYITWVNNQSYCHLLPSENSTKLLYDITDDWSHASVPPHILEQIKADDGWMLKNADEVIVCSDDLLRNKKERCRSIHLIRNGVKLAPYLPESLSSLQVPSEIKFDGPVCGYIGTLHEDRLDVELIVQVAKQLLDYNFVFIGPNSLSAANTKVLEELQNVHLLGARPYGQLPAYMSGFAVCMTPHVVTAFTESLDPIKMYEYMATGKPIVSTPCAGFRDLRDLIYIAEGGTQFAECVIEAVKESRSDKNRSSARVEWASQQTWDKRVDTIERLLGWDAAKQP